MLSSPSPWCNYNFSFAFADVMLFPVFNLSHLFTLNLYKDSYVWELLFCKSHCVASTWELFQFKILEDRRRFRSTTRTISWQLSYSNIKFRNCRKIVTEHSKQTTIYPPIKSFFHQVVFGWPYSNWNQHWTYRSRKILLSGVFLLRGTPPPFLYP